eukprot:1575811-Pyramimonas_sp.AAC.1
MTRGSKRSSNSNEAGLGSAPPRSTPRPPTWPPAPAARNSADSFTQPTKTPTAETGAALPRPRRPSTTQSFQQTGSPSTPPSTGTNGSSLKRWTTLSATTFGNAPRRPREPTSTW